MPDGMLDRFILLAMTPVTLATGAYGWASSAVAETSGLPVDRVAGPVAGDIAASDASIDTPSVDGRLILSDVDGLFRIVARFDGKPEVMVIDTGATVTVLSSDVAARLGIDARGGKGGTLRTAGGPMRYRRVMVGEISIGARTARNVRVAVVTGSMPHSLMGQDVISQLGPVTIDGGRLSLQ